MSTKRNNETAINELTLPLGSAFLGTTYLQKFVAIQDANTGEQLVKVWVHGENQMEQIIVKDIPVTTQVLRDLEDAPIHAPVELKNLYIKFYASGNGSFSEQKTTCKAGGIEVLKTTNKTTPTPAQTQTTR